MRELTMETQFIRHKRKECGVASGKGKATDLIMGECTASSHSLCFLTKTSSRVIMPLANTRIAF
jgi:hypothetical protein